MKPKFRITNPEHVRWIKKIHAHLVIDSSRVPELVQDCPFEPLDWDTELSTILSTLVFFDNDESSSLLCDRDDWTKYIQKVQNVVDCAGELIYMHDVSVDGFVNGKTAKEMWQTDRKEAAVSEALAWKIAVFNAHGVTGSPYPVFSLAHLQ